MFCHHISGTHNKNLCLVCIQFAQALPNPLRRCVLCICVSSLLYNVNKYSPSDVTLNLDSVRLGVSRVLLLMGTMVIGLRQQVHVLFYSSSTQKPTEKACLFSFIQGLTLRFQARGPKRSFVKN